MIRKLVQDIGPRGQRPTALDSQQKVLDRLPKTELLDGRLVTSVALTTGQDNIVPHGLGRAALGRIITDQNADARIWTSSTTNAAPDRQLVLKCSANVTVSLWVF